MRYWLMKSEPDVFGIEHLAAAPKRTAGWDGVRNYQVRNMLRDDMQKGDLALFYHSSCAEPGIVGSMRIVSAGYPDTTAFQPRHHHFDPKSDPKKPTWYMVDVQFQKRFPRTLGLPELKLHKDLKSMLILRRGNRLSITPVTPAEWKTILELAAS
jgi:predicted RNA-binding protein with PUA-like domain